MEEKTIRSLAENFCRAAGLQDHVDVIVEAVREAFAIGRAIRERRYKNDEKAAWTSMYVAHASLKESVTAAAVADVFVVERRKRYAPPGETEAKAEVERAS